MSMLNFKYGLYENLPDLSSSTIGTVYITTDEQSMYVDLPDEKNSNAAKRIQISQIITLESTKEWKELKPPYSETAFYYIANQNALLKYTGINDQNEYVWKQINSTTDVQNNLNSLASAVSTLQGTVNTNANTMNSHINDKTSNPHGITKVTVELGNVDNKSVATIKSEFTGEVAANNLNFPTGDKVHTAIEAAKKVASDDLADHIGDTDNPHEVTATQLGVGDFKDKTVAGIKSSWTGEVAANNSNFPTGDKVHTAIQTVKTAVLGQKDGVDFNKTVLETYTLADSANTAAAGAQRTADAITTGATNLTTLKKVEEKFASLKTTDIGGMSSYATDNELSSTITTLRGGYTGTLAALNTAISTNATNIGTNATNISNLDTRLTGMIQAADALQYKGTVSAFNGLPTTSSSTKPSIGWTYKVVPATSTSSINPVFTLAAANATSGKATPVYSGDLLIATGTETDGVITSNLKWDYIPSGYNADYNPQLKVSNAEAETAVGDMQGFEKDSAVTIDLYSATPPVGATQGDLGSITFAVESGSALRITADNTENKVGNITLGLVWGTF